MTVQPPEPDAAGVRRLLEQAREVLDAHPYPGDGACGGCLAGWSRLVPSPCEQARWAAAVLQHYGRSPGGPSETR
ncbi:hypothetical protein [Micromonospora sp. NPDC126480]|uniref:hypothetical protein n=1 Tax=Micromonospora sp. NPDC126480 TaxID=3155312 RepID=UPI003330818E